MNQQMRDCLVHKAQLIEKMKQITNVKKEELSAYVYQLDQVVRKMSNMAQNYNFRSERKKHLFYQEAYTETLIYYGYARELAQFYCEFPVDPATQSTYTYASMQHYQSYTTLYFQQYSAFCAQELSCDYTEIQTYLRQGDSLLSWRLFDEKHPALFFVYFSSLQLILHHLQEVVLHRYGAKNQPLLSWKRSKLDLCLVVYATYLCNKTNQEKGKMSEWATIIGDVFGVEINKHFSQTIGEFKKRKDISANFIAEMHQVIVNKYEEVD